MKTKKQENKALRKLAKEALNAPNSEVCQTWKEKIIEAVPSLEVKPTLEYDRWVSCSKESKWLMFYPKNGGRYGFNSSGGWHYEEKTHLTPGGHDKENYYETDKEVEQALISEAKKRGLWEVPIIETDGDEGIKKGYYIVNFLENCLWSSFGMVFENGKWAEIIQNTITKAEAEQKLGLTIID